MTVAATPAASNSCGGTFSPVATAGSVTLSGASLAAGATCTLTVNVTTSSAGVRTNSVAASHVLNATTYTGPTATANLTTLAPSLRLQKQIGLSATGPWASNIQVATGTAVYYRFIVENTGLVALNGVAVTDSLLPGASMAACNATISSPLPVANLANEDHIDSCVVGPVTAGASTTVNTASAASTTPSTTSNNASATYTIVTNLPQLKAVKTLVSPTPPIAPGANATYQIVVRNQGLAATTGTIYVYDDLLANLTFLSYSGTNWVCNGSDPLSCSYSGGSLAPATTQGGLDGGVTTALQFVVRVETGAISADNTARAIGGGDGRCPTLSFSANADCVSSVQAGTLPVTLSDVEVAVESGQLVVRFGTASELGSLQYAVYSDLAGRPAGRALLARSDAAGTSLTARRYEVSGAYSGQTQIWIEEESIDGKKERYGPYPVGLRTGERTLSTPIDWARINAEQRAFRQGQTRALLGATPTGDVQVELGVAESGIVVITHEQLLAAGVDWSGLAASRLRLAVGPQQVPFSYQGPTQIGAGSQLSFVAQAVAGSRYTKTRAYRLSMGASEQAAARSQYARPGALAGTSTAAGTRVHAPQRLYDMSSAQSDPWTAVRMIRNNTPLTSYTETFTVSDRAVASSGEVLVVDLHGGIDQPQSPDHSVRLYLNDQLIGQRRFDGLVVDRAQIALPPGVLRQGSNALRVEMVGDTGAPASVVYLDAIEARYLRELRAVDDRLELALPAVAGTLAAGDRIHADNFDDLGVASCSGPGCGAYTVGGYTRPDVRLIHQRADGSIAELAGVRAVLEADQSYTVSFAVPLDGGTLWSAPAQTGVAATLMPRPAPRSPIGNQPADYLIVAHPSFISGLAPLVATRRAEGFAVQVVDVEDVYDAYTDGVVDPAAISALIADAVSQLGTRYVLLVGGDTYDYFDYTGAHSQSFIPTHYRAIGPVIRHTPTDVPYADIDGDGMQDVAIGRLPVRTQSELALWLGKLDAYSTGSYGGRLLRVSDRRLGSVDYGAELGALNFSLNGYATTRIALDDYPAGGSGVALARADMVSAMGAGQSLTAFLGHSSPSSWARESLLTAAQVSSGLLANSTRPTVAWVLGCYGGYAVDPVYNNVAPALMVQPGGSGAVAVMGTSALTSTASDVAWMNAVRPYLTTERLGDALMQAQRRLHEHGSLYEDAVGSAMLLGDPAMRLR